MKTAPFPDDFDIMMTMRDYDILTAFHKTTAPRFLCGRVTSLALIEVHLVGLRRTINGIMLFRSLRISPKDIGALWNVPPDHWWNFLSRRKRQREIQSYVQLGIFKVEPTPFIAIAKVLGKPVVVYQEVTGEEPRKRFTIDPFRGVI